MPRPSVHVCMGTDPTDQVSCVCVCAVCGCVCVCVRCRCMYDLRAVGRRERGAHRGARARAQGENRRDRSRHSPSWSCASARTERGTRIARRRAAGAAGHPPPAVSQMTPGSSLYAPVLRAYRMKWISASQTGHRGSRSSSFISSSTASPSADPAASGRL